MQKKMRVHAWKFPGRIFFTIGHVNRKKTILVLIFIIHKRLFNIRLVCNLVIFSIT